MLSDLEWLPKPPSDFREVVGALARYKDGIDGPNLVRLATHKLTDSQLARLASIANRIEGTPAPFARIKLGIAGDGTLSLFSPAIIASGLRHGLIIEVVDGAYGLAVQEAADPDSMLRAAGLDLMLLSFDYRLAGLDRAALGEGAAERQVDIAFQRIRMVVEGLAPSVSGPLMVQTLVPPLEPLFGSLDRLEPGSTWSMVEALNRRLSQWAREGKIILVDVARLAAAIGYERWSDPGHWYASKLSFSPHYIPAYAELVARTIGTIKGKGKKVLVLDLDNTLWGGIVGDDGIEGIKLGQGSATGEAYLAVQQMALELRGRGVVLAVCSKNEDDAARLPFRQHSEMLLRENHIAVFQANWTDKATNLRSIADALNVGVDALVFLDDNPAEREQVRRELPMVGVPELPDDPTLYPRILAAAGYFDAITFSDEDRNRADLYQSNAARAELMASASDVESYLRSLAMVCTFGPVDARNRSRAAQLINKSNQYNLTTRRYTETELAKAEADPACHLFQVRLVDCFGDHGLISVIITENRGADWEIGTWLMSCRVLGRKVQEAALARLVADARAEGARRLVGLYIPSDKNRMVEDHYAKLGFAADGKLEGGASRWVLELATYTEPELPMQIDVIINQKVSA